MYIYYGRGCVFEREFRESFKRVSGDRVWREEREIGRSRERERESDSIARVRSVRENEKMYRLHLLRKLLV